MTVRASVGQRLSLGSALLASAIVLVASAHPRAQSERPDARWRAWLGCWVPATPQAATGSEPRGQYVCVVPSAGASAVDIVTVADGRILSREHIEASGERRKSEREGCTGWEAAEWSPDARRVYLQSEYECTDGVKRGSSGLIAMARSGAWLNIVGLTVGEETGVRVQAHRAANVPPALAAETEIASALEGSAGFASDAARVAAAASVGTAEIAEASKHLHAAVVEAWLSELGQTFTLDAKRLVQLADQGVPDRVIDMMVALSYPKAFAVKPSPGAIGSLATYESAPSPFICGPSRHGFSLFGWDGCSPYGYSWYDLSPWRSGYSPYGSGFGDGGWYLGSQPAVIVLRPADASGSTHGQVVNGRGYVQGSGADSAAATGERSATSESSGSAESSGSPSSSSSAGSSSDSERTAHPR